MELRLKNANIYKNGSFIKKDFPLDSFISAGSFAGSFSDFNNIYVLPAFCDVHVHFREPGFFYKETIKSGTLAAARGGYTDVCTMPNLNPVPDSAENLKIETDIINQTAVIKVHPYAAITRGEAGAELADLESTAPNCIAFSDDGRGVQSEDLMRRAMLEVKRLGKIIAAHCEDNSLLKGGYIHDGEYAKAHGHKGICSESEWRQIERDLRLVKETGCKYHVCHISAAESVELIRKAKAKGLDVTCETAPHYLVLDDSNLKEDGRFKMNPPLRSARDRLALIEGIKDGTVDMVATDHAPHQLKDKAGGALQAASGMPFVQFSLISMLSLSDKGILPVTRIAELMAHNPARLFNVENRGFIKRGYFADLAIVRKSDKWTLDKNGILSKCKWSPLEGEAFDWRVERTYCNGKCVYDCKTGVNAELKGKEITFCR